MRVKNITTDTIGWSGLTFAPGEVIDVPTATAAAMVTRNPAKFVLMVVDESPIETAPNRMQTGGRKRS